MVCMVVTLSGVWLFVARPFPFQVLVILATFSLSDDLLRGRLRDVLVARDLITIAIGRTLWRIGSTLGEVAITLTHSFTLLV